MDEFPVDIFLPNDELSSFHQAKLAKLEKDGDLIDCSMINPDLAPPSLLLDKLMEASHKPANHRYAVARGVRRLREGFATKYQSEFGVTLDPETEVCVTAGNKDALTLALKCFSGSRQGVLMGAPTYPGFAAAAQLNELGVTTFSIKADEAQMLNAIAQAISANQPRVLLLNFPNNPTGIQVSKEFYDKLADILDGSDTFVMNDFAYGEMSFTESATSILANPKLRTRSVEFYSLSKAYSIPGWRVAAVMGNPSLVARIARLRAHTDYGTFLPLQFAAVAALTAPHKVTAEITNHYAARSRIFAQGLANLGFEVDAPTAGCSVWARLPVAVQDEQGFINSLLANGVAPLPGIAFGLEYARWLRFALVQPAERLRQALARISSLMPQTTKVLAGGLA